MIDDLNPTTSCSTPSESLAAAERCAAFLIAQAQVQVKNKAWQGAWERPFPMPKASEALQALAQRRLFRVPFRAVRSLCAWAHGCRIEVLDQVPPVSQVLELQSWGSRCVSLLPSPAQTTYNSTPLDFAVHDLCHLDKFLEPPLYAEQIGFFATMHELLHEPRWLTLEATFDEEWIAGRERVAADMNGSPIYLFAMLKMQLKLAARRQLARINQEAPPVQGNLSPRENEHFVALQTVLLDALGWSGALRAAGEAISARRDSPESAQCLCANFAEKGEAILAKGRQKLEWQTLYSSMPLPAESTIRDPNPSQPHRSVQLRGSLAGAD